MLQLIRWLLVQSKEAVGGVVAVSVLSRSLASSSCLINCGNMAEVILMSEEPSQSESQSLILLAVGCRLNKCKLLGD